MSNEIERKFLVKTTLDLSNFQKLEYERYFLFRGKRSEIRIQKKWKIYELERKVTENNFSAQKEKLKISEEEFLELKELSQEKIIRKSYKISDNPEITLKIYSWKFEWLQRIEVEFESEKQAQDFKKSEWFWREITGTSLARDSKLLELTEKEFFELLEKYCI